MSSGSSSGPGPSGSARPRAVPLDRATALRPGQLRKLTDFALGARLAVRGGGESLARSALTALGVGLAMVALLYGASIPRIISARNHRAQAQAIRWTDKSQPLLGMLVTTYFHGTEIDGLALQATGTHAAVPPGLTAVPKSGQLVVSPAVKAMIDSTGGQQLRRLLGGTVVQVIGKAGLKGPGQLIYYLGASDLSLRQDAGPIAGFNGTLPNLAQAEDQILVLLEIALAVGLFAPIGQFMVTASRFGSERRNERLASIRLIGASRQATARIATGEMLPGVLGGMLLGAVLFVLSRPLVEHLSLFGVTAFSSDVQPSLALGAAVVVLTPLLCVLATLSAMRKTMRDPLGATRQRTPAKRGLAWRVVLLVLGFALLAPLFLGARSLTGTSAALEAAIGILLVLLGVAALTPWMIETVVGRASGTRSPSWLLAVRTLRARQGTAGRVIGAIALAVAGAIALQIVFTSVDHRNEATPSNQAYTAGLVTVNDLVARTPAALSQLDARLATIRGVRSVTILVPTQENDAKGTMITYIVVAPCATLDQFKALRPCTWTSSYISARYSSQRGTRWLTGGSGPFTMPMTGTVPRDARAVRIPSGLDDLWGGLGTNWLTYPTTPILLLAPGAAERLHIRDFEVGASLDFAMPPGTWGQLYNDVAMIDPVARIEGGNYPTSTFSDRLSSLNNLLLAGALLVLLIVAASVLVATAEQLRERRAAIAGLAAIGAKRSTLTLSLVWQIALQLAIGTGAAIVFGIALGAALVGIEGVSVEIDAGAILALAGAGIGLVATVTLASLPLLGRQMRPAAMRTE